MSTDSAPIRIALWCDVDMNVVDGSSIWLQSIAGVLVEDPRVELTILLRMFQRDDLLTAPLAQHPRITLIHAEEVGVDEDPVSASDALDFLERMDDRRRFDVVLLRGVPTLDEVARRTRFDGRLWLYFVARYTTDEVLGVLAGKAHRILCPTERMRQHVLATVPDSSELALTMPPMIPAIEPASASPGGHGDAPQLLYAGTITREYRFYETVEMFRRLRKRYPRARLHMAVGKVGLTARRRRFRLRAALKLRLTRGLVRHGSVPREQVHELTRRSDVAISLRDAHIQDHRDCISSKVLEYCAARRPVLLTRIPIYEEMLGADYPLFADDESDPEPVVAAALADPATLERAAAACFEASRPYTFARVAEGIAPHLEDAVAAAAGHP
jgi:glycosyltransferase involved in cell wall biosynthesis